MVQTNSSKTQKPKRIPPGLRWGAVSILLITAIVIAVLYWNPPADSGGSTPNINEQQEGATGSGISEHGAADNADADIALDSSTKEDTAPDTDTYPETDTGSETDTAPDTDADTQPNPDQEPAIDLTQHSIDDPNSIWLVVNKHRPLDPLDFEPSDLEYPAEIDNEFEQPLRAAAAAAVEEMYLAAQKDGVWFRIISAYRPYSVQENLYASYGARDGFDLADTYSARPGHSEHQTGLAIDFDDGGDCYLMECFGDTVAGAWLADNAAEFGFIVRYQSGQEDITGFMPEPWHFRYVGSDLAKHMTGEGVATLEEIFELGAAPGYLD